MAIQFGDSFSGTISADAFRGTLNASDLTQGTIPAARFPTSGVNATAIGDGSVTNTEFQALSSVTSDIQTQLNNRVVVNTAFATLTSTGDLTIADRMTHSGDADTAIRFPSNDTVSVDTAGTEKLRITSAGNIGIGTSAPSTKLHVSGAGFNGGGATFEGTDSGNGVNIRGYNGAGINDTTFVTLSDNTSSTFTLISRTGTNAGGEVGRFRIGHGGAERFSILSAGNVGIGTTAPSQRLTVSGNISASGDLFASGNNNTLNRLTVTGITVTGNSSFGQAISANSTIRSLTETFDVNKLPVTPNAQIAYNLASFRYNTGNFTGGIVFTAPVLLETIMHWMEIDGYIYNNVGPFKCVIQGYKTSIWNTTGLYKQLLSDYDIPMFWGVAPNGNSCLVLSGTNLDWPQIHITKAMFSHSNGGNTSYSEGWSVSAVNNLNGFTGLVEIPTVTKFKDLTITESGVVDVNSTNNALRITQRGSGNALVVEDSTTPDSTPFVITNAGNVGIGTSTPNRTLTVNGSISAAGGIAIGTVTGSGLVSIGNNRALTMESTNGFTSNLSGLNIFKWTDNNLYVDNYDKDIVVRGPSATQRIRITEAGNVSIGTALPTARLDVRGGNIYLNGQLSFTNDSGVPFLDNWIGRYNDGTTDWLHIGGITTSSVRRIGMYANIVYFDGNVGMGTTSPTQRLVVAQNATDGGWLHGSGVSSFLGLGGYALGTAGAFRLNYDRTTGDITFSGGTRDTPTERMRITGTGNIGIGTSTPATRLHVNGTVTATSFSGPITGNVTGNVTGTASAIADGTVSTNKIVSGAVTSAKLAAKVTFPNYEGGSVLSYQTTYRASVDGYLCVNVSGSFINGIEVVVGATNAPTRIIWQSGDDINTNTKQAGSGLLPIPKDYYYRVQPRSGVAAYESISIIWYPVQT